VIPDPEAAAQRWYGEHGLVPVNHMVVVTQALARSNPQAVAELASGKTGAGMPAAGQIDTAPFGKEANRPCLELLVSYAVQQRLISRKLTVEELW
jgi:4,5-dihydroxyphthalate decarboxylase